MSKSIRAIASEYGVSYAAVWKRLNKFKEELAPYIHDDGNGNTVVDPAGVEILCRGLTKAADKTPDSDDQTQDKSMDHLLAFNTLLQEQIKAKDQTITDLLNQNATLLNQNVDLERAVVHLTVLLRTAQDQLVERLPLSSAPQANRANRIGEANSRQAGARERTPRQDQAPDKSRSSKTHENRAKRKQSFFERLFR